MRERAEDIRRMQSLLHASYDAAGPHLRAVHSDEARITARQLADTYTAMQVMVIATVSRDGRPFTGPVDSFLYRGSFHFGTSVDAVRARHRTANPEVSGTHVRGEGLVVVVHGRVRALRLTGEDAGFAEVTREHYGTGWDEWDDVAAWAIEARRLFAADMSVHGS